MVLESDQIGQIGQIGHGVKAEAEFELNLDLEGELEDQSDKNYIDRGGFGTIYNSSIKGRVFKKFHQKFPNESFIRELSAYRLLEKTKCPYIPALYRTDIGNCILEIKKYPKNLAKYLETTQTNGKLSESKAIYIILQLAHSISWLYICGIQHRDIKPDNILINNKQNISLCDLGLCRFIDNCAPEHVTGIVQTIWYRAPEILNSNTNDQSKIDVWSFGLIALRIISILNNYDIYELVLNSYTEEGQLELINKMIGDRYSQKYGDFSKIEKFCPLEATDRTKSLFNIIKKCLHIDHKLRPNPIELWEMLNQLDLTRIHSKFGLKPDTSLIKFNLNSNKISQSNSIRSRSFDLIRDYLESNVENYREVIFLAYQLWDTLYQLFSDSDIWSYILKFLKKPKFINRIICIDSLSCIFACYVYERYEFSCGNILKNFENEYNHKHCLISDFNIIFIYMMNRINGDIYQYTMWSIIKNYKLRPKIEHQCYDILIKFNLINPLPSNQISLPILISNIIKHLTGRATTKPILTSSKVKNLVLTLTQESKLGDNVSPMTLSANEN